MSSVDLSKARRVVGVGRGLVAQNDLEMVRQLASVLGAEVGCSRPIAEGENWMERERYIGVSGVLLKSDLYLTLGISGQIQHMVGGNGAKVIVAINKDKKPLFSITPITVWWATSTKWFRPLSTISAANPVNAHLPLPSRRERSIKHVR